MDDRIVKRLREALDGKRGVSERKMFGGVAFLLNGHMCCGVTKDDDVVVRIGAEAYDAALESPDVRACDFTGRPMRGMVMLNPAARKSPARFRRWVAMAASFAGSLPRKPAAPAGGRHARASSA